MQPTFDGFEKRRNYWAYLFARLKPGVSIEQARVSMNAKYQPIITDVEAPLQTGHERTDAGALQSADGRPRARGARAELCPPRSVGAAHGAF